MKISEISNIYCISGFINEKGNYETDDGIVTLIAECRQENMPGYSYYAFYNINQITHTHINTNAIRVNNLMGLIENPNIVVNKLADSELEKRRSYFSTLLENATVINESSKYNARTNK